MRHKHNAEYEYNALSKGNLFEVKAEIIAEATRRIKVVNKWLRDELERIDQAHDDLHAISLKKVLKKLKK